MSSSWLINVNARKYNILGGVREFGEEMPWYFGGKAQVEKGNVVYFYLTDAVGKDGDKGKYKLVDSLFKRFIFKGEVTEVTDEILNYDEEYWNDLDYKKKTESKEQTYAKIKITEVLYDLKIMSGDVDQGMWKQGDAYKLNPDVADSLERLIEERR